MSRISGVRRRHKYGIFSSLRAKDSELGGQMCQDAENLHSIPALDQDMFREKINFLWAKINGNVMKGGGAQGSLAPPPHRKRDPPEGGTT